MNLNNAERYVWFDPPANRPDGSISVIPGQVLQFGTFTGYSVQPRITSVKRVLLEEDVEAEPGDQGFALVKGEPTNTIEVKWEYDTRNAFGASPDNSYSVADAVGTLGGVTGGSTPATLPDQTAREAERTGVDNGTTVTHKRTTTYIIADTEDADYGEIDVTVSVDVTGNDPAAAAAAATSASVELAAVATAVTGLKAVRKITVSRRSQRHTHAHS